MTRTLGSVTIGLLFSMSAHAGIWAGNPIPVILQAPAAGGDLDFHLPIDGMDAGVEACHR